MKKVILDQEKCIGCGACVAISPENFDFDEGISKLINDEVSENTIEASEMCPVMAIEIINEECDCNECNCEDNEEHECCNHDCHCNCCK